MYSNKIYTVDGGLTNKSKPLQFQYTYLDEDTIQIVNKYNIPFTLSITKLNNLINMITRIYTRNTGENSTTRNWSSVGSHGNLAAFTAMSEYDTTTQFSTYFSVIAKNMILMGDREDNRHFGTYTTQRGNSYSTVSYDVEGILTAVESRYNPKDNIERNLISKDILQCVSLYIENHTQGLMKDIMSLYMEGYNTQEISKVLDKKPQQITSYKRRFRERFYCKYPNYKDYLKSL